MTLVIRGFESHQSPVESIKYLTFGSGHLADVRIILPSVEPLHIEIKRVCNTTELAPDLSLGRVKYFVRSFSTKGNAYLIVPINGESGLFRRATIIGNAFEYIPFLSSIVIGSVTIPWGTKDKFGFGQVL